MPCPHVALSPQLYHSHSFPVPWIGTLSLSRRLPPKYICKRKIIGLTESSISLDVAHTYPYRSFLRLSKEQRFKKNVKKPFAKYTNTELINLTQPKKHGQLIIFYWYLHNVAWWKVITLNSSHVNNTLLIPSSGPICNQHQIFVFVYIPRNIEPFLWSHVLLYVWAYQSCSSLF